MVAMQALEALTELLLRLRERGESILALTGAGISAESGIRTFRGPGGYWNEDSPAYRPEDMATQAFFRSEPELSWTWYLLRRQDCRRAQPNAAHTALNQLATFLEGRVDLVTQNVDGLHRRSGFPPRRLMEIHGNLDFIRCNAGCSGPPWPVPASFDQLDAGFALDSSRGPELRCRTCGDWGRPHVLWFDEYYDETHFHLMSAQAAARRAGLMLVVGTTGTTNLPHRLGQIAAERGIPMVDINVEDNLFRRYAAEDESSLVFEGEATIWLQRICAALESA